MSAPEFVAVFVIGCTLGGCCMVSVVALHRWWTRRKRK